MNYFKGLFVFTTLCTACIDRSEIKKEIADFHACITKCEDIENTNTFNFFKCSQACVDLAEEKKKVLSTLNPDIREKGMADILDSRNQCIDRCQERVVTVRAEVKEQIKKCKDICIYNLKK